MADLIRLQHSRTGVIVNVDAGTRDTLDREWVADGEPEIVAPAGQGDELTPPAGNASTEEWATFARSLGIEIDEGAKRDEIRALVTSLIESDEGSEDESE